MIASRHSGKKPHLRLVLTMLLIMALVIGSMGINEDVLAKTPGYSILGGSTRDSSGMPIGHVKVILKSVDETVTLQTESNSDGNYLIQEIPAGTYTLSFDHKNYLKQSYNDRIHDLSDEYGADTIEVKESSSTEINQILQKASSISGKILRDSKPVNDFSIDVYRKGSDGWYKFSENNENVITGSDGEYKITQLPSGEYRFRVTYRSEDSTFYGNTHLFQNAKSVFVDENDVTGKDINEKTDLPVYTVSGKVTVASSDKNDAYVTLLYNDRDFGWMEMKKVEADPVDGSYALNGIHSSGDSYAIQFSHYDCLTKFFKNSLTLGSDQIMGFGNNLKNVDVSLPKAPTISGRVTDKSGTPVTTAKISARFKESSGKFDTISMTNTNSNGEYTLPLNRVGDYALEYRDSTGKLATKYWNNQSVIDESDLITIDDNSSDRTGFDVVMKDDPTISIKGFSVTGIKQSYVYSGKAITPEPNVGYLVKDRDYTVSYMNNIDAGVATVIVTGKGDYSGTTKVNFTIAKAKQTVTVPVRIYVKSYSDAPFTISAATSGDGSLSFSSNKKIVQVDGNGKVTIKGSGIATITINAAATKNYEAASQTVKITVTPKKVNKPKAKTGKRKMKISWKKDSNASGYQIVYASNKKFTKGKKTVNIKKNTTVSKTIKKLKKGKTYYVKVRSYKTSEGEKIYGKFSTAKKVKIKK